MQIRPYPNNQFMVKIVSESLIDLRNFVEI